MQPRDAFPGPLQHFRNISACRQVSEVKQAEMDSSRHALQVCFTFCCCPIKYSRVISDAIFWEIFRSLVTSVPNFPEDSPSFSCTPLVLPSVAHHVPVWASSIFGFPSPNAASLAPDAPHLPKSVHLPPKFGYPCQTVQNS